MDSAHSDVNDVTSSVRDEALYQEKYRPQFHFTARQWNEHKLNPGRREEGWCNDLNGLVYYDGEYHLFAQRWNRCWIHAVSNDLVHWLELEPAFWEESLESGVQSGNCVIDYANSSGLATDANNPPMVAFWSRQDNLSTCISYSLDHGRSWKHYANNPVLEYPERDPMVFWHETSKRWVMMMYGRDQYHIFTASDLLSWTNENHSIPNSFECPDFFQLPVDDNFDHLKWVLIRGDGMYSIGEFDGVQFVEETAQLKADVGPNFYATQSWGNTTTGDGRRIQAAWMRDGEYPDMPFNQQITFPCELALKTTSLGLRLFRQPIKEIESLFIGEEVRSNLTVDATAPVDLSIYGDLQHITLQLNIPPAASLVFGIRGTSIVLTQQTIAEDTSPTCSTIDTINYVELLIDRTSIEIFVNHGELSLSKCYLPTSDTISISVAAGSVLVSLLTINQIGSSWTLTPLGDTGLMQNTT